MRGALLVPIAILAGCYSPHYQDCVISCASNACPSGFDCRDDKMCRPSDTTGTCQNIESDARQLVDTSGDAPYPTGMWNAAQMVDVMMPDVSDPTLTDDLLEMYFTHLGDIWVTKRSSTASAWSTPVAVPELGSPVSDHNPNMTPDGLTMLLASDRPGSTGIDLWQSKRSSRSVPWGTPVRVPELESNVSDNSASLSYDELTIVFSSDRLGSNTDIFMATRTAGSPWTGVRELPELNIVNQEDTHPWLSPDKRTIYFMSDRTGGGDLYVARRATPADPFDMPQAISELNHGSNFDGDPWVSPDGHHIFFASDISGVSHIYEATR
ncbi:MAG TPA: hypothetical protein VMZ53_25105 [Kofleriaceae bacterium]|nr:hypothetical protein [Kofleriaceae bacterium]